jgi:alkylated DNA repair dioxygenase AlkB
VDAHDLSPAARRLPAPGADVRLHEGWLPRAEADELLAQLLAEVPWRQERISLFGRSVLLPRLTAWFGGPGADYRYSGLHLRARPFPPRLEFLRRRVEVAVGQAFNAVLLNLYRSGADGVSWHRDDEPDLGEAPWIASLSLGATRTFQLRPRGSRGRGRLDVPLPHGSLLVMAPPTQARWEHRLPKRAAACGPRVNLTFRRILPAAQPAARPGLSASRGDASGGAASRRTRS